MWDSVLQWAQANIEWAIPVVFVFAFLESLIVISIFVPGWLLLVGMGSLVGAGVLPFYPVVTAAYFGAVLGESLGFWVGRRHADWVHNSAFTKDHQRLLSSATQIFQRYGVMSLVLGRFIGPIRAVLPFVAGVMQFPWKWFWPTNLLSGLLWAPAYLLPGMLVGASYHVALSELWPLAFHAALIIAFIWTSAHLWRSYRRMAWLSMVITGGLMMMAPFMDYWPVLLSVLSQLLLVIQR